MARIKFGSIVTDGRGSLGGHTFQNSRGGMQLRTKPVNKKQPSTAQELIRSYNPKLQFGWRSLTDEQRKIWDEYAVSHHVTNKSGDKHPLSGHSLWMKYQFQYISNGFPLQSNVFKASAGPYGPELIQNGNFQSSDFWSVTGGWSLSSGYALYDGLAYGDLIQTLSLPFNTYYKLEFAIYDCPSTVRMRVNRQSNQNLAEAPYNIYANYPNGSYTWLITTAADCDLIAIRGVLDFAGAKFTSFSLREIL